MASSYLLSHSSQKALLKKIKYDDLLGYCYLKGVVYSGAKIFIQEAL